MIADPFTNAQINAIDVVLKACDVGTGSPIFCHTVNGDVSTRLLHLITEPVPVEAKSAGFTSFAPIKPIRPRSPYERSYWVKRDSDSRCVPLLHVFATILHEDCMLAKTSRPYWVDKDPNNAILANVKLHDLAPQIIGRPPPAAKTTVSKYGMKSGTKEYWRAYWKDPVNRQKQREASRKSVKRHRSRIKEAKMAMQFAQMQKSILGYIPRHDGGVPDAEIKCSLCETPLDDMGVCEWCNT